MSPLHELARQWREEAETLRQYDADRLVTACEAHAEQLEAAIRAHEAEPLTVQEAAQESGYSPDHLRRLVREDELPNAGEEGSPRIRRGDLPRKPRQDKSGDGSDSEPPIDSRTQMARSVVESE